ncbi:hypothetical protein TPHA_0I03110 [Tetrapisispora phaffii CBS 4417]|uniref:RRM domain-containing protein n=1 Tax=Tetrapisispora phaffii (strain ATCC 24235 / CBS 4417 / NBRC 1672 / NRRL Y-8282 / UCD 70-5) TaxID=1071381 RepID=G8BY34_TETPH|nr:hypothetical protein TPHA_0I03110 [Tetrapisispora phaffii CBS 4417]CCE64812.1 hypothetical protein TPHA_0I03110 [Tetrapisispora phaffii CBS 4417]
MAPAKKNVKMDLNSFLNDETFGSSWADEDVDLNKINIPIESAQANTIPLEELAAANMAKMGAGGRGSRLDPALGAGARRDFQRTEYPVPDVPPYKAIINNIPWDITPEGVTAWVEDGLEKEGAVVDLALPTDMRDPSRLKGIAFVEFAQRDDLVKALTFNATRLNDRTVYVSVAGPRREFSRGGEDFDWGAARGSNFQGGRPDREEANLDWGAARGSNYQERKPRREEPNLDWGVARGSNYQERRPEREEVNLDWGAARGSNYQERKPRREEPNLDWGSARGSNFGEQGNFNRAPRERKPRKDEPELDWGSARGAKYQQKTQRYERTVTEKTEEKPKIQQSAFAVLSNDVDNEEDEEEVKTPAKKEEEITQLEREAAKLSVNDGDDSEWEVAGKK